MTDAHENGGNPLLEVMGELYDSKNIEGMSFFDGLKYFQDINDFIGKLTTIIKEVETTGGTSAEKKAAAIASATVLLDDFFPAIKPVVVPVLSPLIDALVWVFNTFYKKPNPPK